MLRFSSQRYEDGLATETEKEWHEQLNGFEPELGIALASTHEARLERARDHIQGKDKTYYYALVRHDRAYAQGLVEVVHRDKGKSTALRVLNIYLEPRLDVENLSGTQVASLDEAAEILIAAIFECYSMTFDDHEASMLKVYGRTDSMVSFLTIVADLLRRRVGLSLNVRMEGRWLAFEKQILLLP